MRPNVYAFSSPNFVTCEPRGLQLEPRMLPLMRRDCSSELTQHVGVAYISGVLADGLFGHVLANSSHLLCHQQQVRRPVLH